MKRAELDRAAAPIIARFVKFQAEAMNLYAKFPKQNNWATS